MQINSRDPKLMTLKHWEILHDSSFLFVGFKVSRRNDQFLHVLFAVYRENLNFTVIHKVIVLLKFVNALDAGVSHINFNSTMTNANFALDLLTLRKYLKLVFLLQVVKLMPTLPTLCISRKLGWAKDYAATCSEKSWISDWHKKMHLEIHFIMSN